MALKQPPIIVVDELNPDGVRRAYDKLGIPIGQDVQDLLATKPARKPGDFERNHMGAPYVNHPTDLKKDGTPRRVVYGRPSSFGTALDNAYNLVKWKERQLLIGVSFLDWDGGIDIDDRDALDQLAARCHQAAGSSLAADRGTHIHLLLEHHDRNNGLIEVGLYEDGERLGIPESLQLHILKQWIDFRRDLGVTALAIEATVVHDGWRLAGTLDRLDVADRDIWTGLGDIPPGVPFIGDIKTGGLTLGRDGQPNYWVKYPVQLAAYADGVPYDVDTDERGEWERQPSAQIALIYHYDLARALDGEPVDWQAIPVNITAGREGGNLCRSAADFGKRRDLFLMPAPSEIAPVADTGVEPTSGTGAATTVPLVDDFHIAVSDGRRGTVTVPTSRTYIRTKIRELIESGYESEIRRQWPAGVPPLTEQTHTVEQLTQLFYMVRRVEAEVGAPFNPEPQPAGNIQHTPDPYKAAQTVIDDGGDVAPDAMQALKDRMLALPDNRIVELAEIVREANEAGRPISVQQKPCVRRWEIARALVIWAETPADLEALWTEVGIVAKERQIVDDDITLGALVSQFSIDQALELADRLQPF